MDNLLTVINVEWKNCFISSVDLPDAYYSILIAKGYQKYFMFSFEDNFTSSLVFQMILNLLPEYLQKTFQSCLFAFTQTWSRNYGTV